MIHLLSASDSRLLTGTQVILDPVAIVKELVDNSVDASARNIAVLVMDYGARSIVCRDDGIGITKDDLSVIGRYRSSSKSLSGHSQLGFRGEALYSLASVSEIVISSRTKDSIIGHTCSIDLSAEDPHNKVTPIAIESHGTTFTVRNLFHNLPVRRTHLASPSTRRKISVGLTTLATSYALARPDVGFALCLNGDDILDTRMLSPATSHDGRAPAAVFTKIFGEKYATMCGSWCFVHRCGLRVDAFISHAQGGDQKNLTKKLYLCLNNRIIDNDALVGSLRAAFRYVSATTCPVGIVNLSLPEGSYDINVTPDKRTVLIRDQGCYCKVLEQEYICWLKGIDSRTTSPLKNPLLRDFVYRPNVHKDYGKSSTVSQSVISLDSLKCADIGAVSTEPSQKCILAMERPSNATYDTDEKVVVKQEPFTVQQASPPPTNASVASSREPLAALALSRITEGMEAPREHFVAESFNAQESNGPSLSVTCPTSGDATHEDLDSTDETKYPVQYVLPLANGGDVRLSVRDFGRMTFLAQYNDSFLVVSLSGQLFLIDQHAANEAANFEQLWRATFSSMERQALVAPQKLRLSPLEALTLARHLSSGVFSRLGFGVERSGSGISLTTYPIVSGIPLGEDDFLEVLHNLETLSTLPRAYIQSYRVTMKGSTFQQGIEPSRVRKILASRACKSSVRLGDSLSAIACAKILSNLASCVYPFNCPHGRPVIKAINRETLQRPISWAEDPDDQLDFLPSDE